MLWGREDSDQTHHHLFHFHVNAHIIPFSPLRCFSNSYSFYKTQIKWSFLLVAFSETLQYLLKSILSYSKYLLSTYYVPTLRALNINYPSVLFISISILPEASTNKCSEGMEKMNEWMKWITSPRLLMFPSEIWFDMIWKIEYCASLGEMLALFSGILWAAYNIMQISKFSAVLWGRTLSNGHTVFSVPNSHVPAVTEVGKEQWHHESPSA